MPVDIYNGKDPADLITYTHKFVEKLTDVRPKGKQLTFRELFGLVSVLRGRLEHKDIEMESGTNGSRLIVNKHICIDPKVAFGRPTVKGTGIKVEVLATQAFGSKEHQLQELADDYGISLEQVKAALEFGMMLVIT